MSGRVDIRQVIINELRCHGFEKLEEEHQGIPAGTYVFNLVLPVNVVGKKSIEEMQQLLKDLKI